MPDQSSREHIETGLLIRAIGYTGRPVAGIPFDSRHGIVPNTAGRVLDSADGTFLSGHYVAGWSKRGSHGGIGVNRHCGEETAQSIIEDLRDGVLDSRPATGADIRALAESRGAIIVDQRGWDRIDTAERTAGEKHGRSRSKLVTLEALYEAAGGEPNAGRSGGALGTGSQPLMTEPSQRWSLGS
ncbi:hypothetical protein ABTW96_32985 [Nocardia beijingensis]|uniref:hypothetical protein n=1 Tax=Nocardia beijingensis TaxID=95162 RepID=UPI00332C40D3